MKINPIGIKLMGKPLLWVWQAANGYRFFYWVDKFVEWGLF